MVKHVMFPFRDLNYIYYQSILKNFLTLYMLVLLLFDFEITLQCYCKKSLSRATGPISTKLGTMHHWVKGFQVCSNEGPRPFPRGENNPIAKIR